jgi:hypothetical protein
MVTVERQKVAAELADFQAMHAAHLFSAAKVEAELRGEVTRLTQLHAKLAREHAALEQRRSGFEAAAQRTEREATVAVHMAQAELLARRDKQFEALVRVQSLEDRLRATQDTSEASVGQQRALAARSAELAVRLEAAMEHVQVRNREVDALRRAKADDDARHEQDLRRKDEHALGLQQQADELGRSLLQVVAKHKERGATLEMRGRQVAALKEELVASRRAEADREAGAAEADAAHGALEQRHEVLRVEASRLAREVRSLRAELDALPRPPLAGSRRAKVETADSDASRLNAINATLRLAQGLAAAVPLPPADPTDLLADRETEPRVSLPLRAVSSLTLGGCGLAEQDLDGVLAQVALCPQLEAVDLRANFLTDRCVGALTRLVEQLPNLKSLGLRGNCLSIDGVRSLALFLEGLRGVRHVYVHRDGQIEALGDPPSGRPSSQGRPLTTLLTVDARDNCSDGAVAPSLATPATAEKLQKAEALSVAQQRRRRPAKRNNAYSSRGDVLANVYGGAAASGASVGKAKSETFPVI